MLPADSSSVAREPSQVAQRVDDSSLGRLREQVRALERALRARTSELEATDRYIRTLEEKLFKLKEVSRELKQLKEAKQRLRNSPERRIGQVLLAPYRLPQKLIRALVRKREGRVAEAGFATEYQRWFQKHRATADQLAVMRAQARDFAVKPLISVIMPVFDTPVKWLEEAVASVVAQAYENWELLVVDDHSTAADLRAHLGTITARDARIHTFRLDRNSGISAALNHGIEQARGDWLGFLDHDDTIEPDALFQMVELLQRFPDADLIYSDEDKLSDAGVERPQFKPDWSPDLFLSANYVSHFTMVRGELVRAVGGFRPEFDGAQDYDLLLRVIERTDRIHHVPRVLYHWRRSASSSAIDIRQKPGQLEAARRAVEEHLARIGVVARVAIDWPTHTFWIRRELPAAQKISIIIPVTTPAAECIARTLEAIARVAYPDYGIVLVGDEKVLRQADSGFDRFEHALLDYAGPAAYSAMNNFAVEQTRAPWLLFMQPNVEPLDVQWLDVMAEHIQRPEVGAVGPLLLGRDNRIENAGIVIGTAGLAQHALRGCAADDPAIMRRAAVTRNCTAVTGACLLTRREVFQQVGGFDQSTGAFYDVDLCLKLRRAGYLIVYTPFAKLCQHGTLGRDVLSDSAEAAIIRARWSDTLQRDPYYNPNLSRERADFSLGN